MWIVKSQEDKGKAMGNPSNQKGKKDVRTYVELVKTYVIIY